MSQGRVVALGWGLMLVSIGVNLLTASDDVSWICGVVLGFGWAVATFSDRVAGSGSGCGRMTP